MDISALRERTDSALSVSELNNFIKSMFDSSRLLNSVHVRGEISNFTNHRSGHLYFSLKDEGGQIKAVMFRSSAMRLKFMPENGMKVTVSGSVTVFPRDGVYQLYVSSMQPDGIGALYLAYEQMKARLAAEGLFDDDHKKLIPAVPRRIGVITSPTGAAVRDIINVTGRRFPMAEVFIYPALVQGEGAENSLIKALDYLDMSGLCDVIIIGRGGGSIEDLWAFNSEALARRIYDARTPIISAVGHETDFTICDFVADLRAPTPSAAAEIAVPDRRELLLRIDSYDDRLRAALVRKLEMMKEKLNNLSEIADGTRLNQILAQKKDDVARIGDMASIFIGKALDKAREKLSLAAGTANALSPLSVLSRGYSVAEKDGCVVKSSEELESGDEIELIFAKGSATAKVTHIVKEK